MHHVHVGGEAREMDVDPVAKLSMISGVLSRLCNLVVGWKGRGRLKGRIPVAAAKQCCLGASAVAIPTSISSPLTFDQQKKRRETPISCQLRWGTSMPASIFLPWPTRLRLSLKANLKYTEAKPSR
jgi:hypothetical protein